MRRALVGLALVTAACGDRESFWDRDAPDVRLAAATDAAVYVVDGPAERVVELSVGDGLSLSTRAFPLGRTPVVAAAAPDRSRVVLLTHGDVPRTRPDDQPAALTAISKAGAVTYPLTDPRSSLVLDPANSFAIVGASASDQFVTNPNELVLVDLRRPASADNPRSHTVRSFGGRPTFVAALPPLSLPGGEQRRLLLTESERELGLVDLEDPSRGEITVRLTSGGGTLWPGAVAADDGDPSRDDDTRVAALLAGEATMVVVELLPPTSASQGAIRAFPTLVSLPGSPRGVMFVSTDLGRRIATLIPSRRSLALVDPATYAVAEIDVGGSFDTLTRAPGAASTGVAFVLTGQVSELALLSLADTAEKPYRSVESLSLPAPVARVLAPVGDEPRVVLELTSGGFAVLDLASRAVAPLATRPGARVSQTFDGAHAVVFAPGASDVSSVALGDLHPINVTLPRPIAAAFDVARPGGRAILSLHASGALGATLLDAAAPSLSGMREFAAVGATEASR